MKGGEHKLKCLKLVAFDVGLNVKDHKKQETHLHQQVIHKQF